MIAARSLILFFVIVGTASGRDFYVNPRAGDDASEATADAPLATAQRAVNLAGPGDVIHLLPKGAVYRQMISLSGKEGITIEGNGVTLTGADPLPADGWKEVSPGLFRRQMPKSVVGRMERHLLIVAGLERMGRSPTARLDFPPPDEITPGQFTWRDIDEQHGWLYVRGETSGLEWSVRVAGLRTSGRNRDITVRNLHARHALNDGFNIHGDARGMRFSNITGYENFDEGFSAHDTCQCWVEDGQFWGNDNAAFDINLSETYYRRCTFRDSLSVEVGFNGGRHRLEDCRIIAAAPVAFRLNPTNAPETSAEQEAASCAFERVVIESAGKSLRVVELGSNVSVRFSECRLSDVRLAAAAASLQIADSTLDGRPWRVSPEEATEAVRP